MKTNLIITTGLLLLFVSGASAQTPSTLNQAPGPGVHKANISPSPTGTLSIKQDRKAERRGRLAAMTPDERKAFKADRKAKRATKLATMTPEQQQQQQQHTARKAERKADRRRLK